MPDMSSSYVSPKEMAKELKKFLVVLQKVLERPKKAR